MSTNLISTGYGKFQPIVIIGAGRSGTNMLRDILCRFPGYGTWPCDEINPIWRHGNLRYPSDEFSREMARPVVKKFIRKQFKKIARRYRLNAVIEKTCANSLRVGFVDAVLPEAKFIFIYRNGLDATASALKRWTAKMELPYLLRKAQFAPLMDLPYFVSRFVHGRIHRLSSSEKRLPTWGPRLDGMQDLFTSYSLEEVCALQWKRCVDRAMEDFSSLAPGRFIQVGYEYFVRKPELELNRILKFLECHVDKTILLRAVSNVSSSSIGKGVSTLGEDRIKGILPMISDSLHELGYA